MLRHFAVQEIFVGRNQPWRLSSSMADPRFAIRNGGEGFQNEITGACAQHSQMADRLVTKELTDKLFANKKILGKDGGKIKF